MFNFLHQLVPNFVCLLFGSLQWVYLCIFASASKRVDEYDENEPHSKCGAEKTLT